MQTRLKASLQNASTPRARSVKDLERPGGEFWTKKHDFYGPFFHPFSDFLRAWFWLRIFIDFSLNSVLFIFVKSRFRVGRVTKNVVLPIPKFNRFLRIFASIFASFFIIFPSFFHQNFMLFPNPSRIPFLEVPSAGFHSKSGFGAISDFPRVPKSTLGATFSAQKVPRGADQTPPGRSWSRPGRCMLPFCRQKQPETVQGSILTDFPGIWERFSMNFGYFLE